ncbi:MAG: glycosyltransferase family 39 protein [Gemmatimonadetes bacterium]|nr:glycosyltransferase family 39 protein [Gemmatimonadota bacterium]MYK53912.1 glycosyltransferase family 39 protein [Gemmatimonadota bacterium]
MSHRQYLWGLLAFALLLRVGFGLSQSDLTNASDEVHWDRLGQAYVALGVLHPDTGMYRPPLYSLFLAGIYHTFGHKPVLVRIAQAILGTITCYFIYVLGCRMGRVLVGLIATGLFAIYPLFIFFSGVLMAETILIFLTTISFLCCVQFWEKNTFTMAMIFGGIVGLSALCKPVLLPWLPLVLFFWWQKSRLAPVQKASRVLTVVGALCLIILPWTARNHIVSGEFVPISTNLGINLLVGAHLEGRGVYDNHIDYLALYHTLADTSQGTAADRRIAGIVLGWIIAQPLHYLSLSIDKLLYFWCPWVPGEPPLYNAIAVLSCTPLLTLGLAGTFIQRQRSEGLALILLIICMSLLHMVFFAHTRFRLPVDAVLCAPAAWVCVQWINRIGRRA